MTPPLPPAAAAAGGIPRAAILPTATYRLQLNSEFAFADAEALAPYLESLGVSTLYASPILQVRPGSRHGYDVTDPTRINAELGGREGFDALTDALSSRGLGLLLDIVPNHMAAHPGNPWWWDVLENGRASSYARFFDIDWGEDAPDGGATAAPIVLPILGAPLDEVLRNGDIHLAFDHDRGLLLRYFDHLIPLDPSTYEPLLRPIAQRLAAKRPRDAVTSLLTAILQDLKTLPSRQVHDSHQHTLRHESIASIKDRLRILLDAHPELRDETGAELRSLSDPRPPGSAGEGSAPLRALLDLQPYRLEFWRDGLRKLNYRRFFDVSELISLRAEDDEVFRATHELILDLVRSGRITGLRIDHIDGLADPLAYLQRLESAIAGPPPPAWAGPPRFYIVAEKILVGDETLASDWPVHGTTGYDALNVLTRALVDSRGAGAIATHARQLLGLPAPFGQTAAECKRLAIESLFPSEQRRLACRLAAMTRLPEPELAAALEAITAALPVYRTYIRDRRPSGDDRARLESALTQARERSTASPDALDALARILLHQNPDPASDEHDPRALEFTHRWQQFTGPVMAKGVEDTALYRHITLACLNEVGSDPDAAADPIDRFHQFFTRRATEHPAALTATSTHDTKRSEDVRARLAVLSEIPDDWTATVDRWRILNAPHKTDLRATSAPAPHDELLLYQSLIGAWPMDDQASLPADFAARIKATMRKSTREAKLETSWLDPDSDYEAALDRFIDAILSDASAPDFLRDIRTLVHRIAPAGAINSLAQLTLKLAAPGIPDFYQGSELWGLSLVDPDNRRPVDFTLRQRLLADLNAAPDMQDLTRSWRDGRIKLYVTTRGLHARRNDPTLFAAGTYTPLQTTGPHAHRLIAFARRLTDLPADRWLIAAAPRLILPFTTPESLTLATAPWADTAIVLPPQAPSTWVSLLTGEPLQSHSGLLPATHLFPHLPTTLLTSHPPSRIS